MLVNLCSANTDSRELGIFWDIFTVDLENVVSLGLVTWYDVEEMAKTHLQKSLESKQGSNHLSKRCGQTRASQMRLGPFFHVGV